VKRRGSAARYVIPAADTEFRVSAAKSENRPQVHPALESNLYVTMPIYFTVGEDFGERPGRLLRHIRALPGSSVGDNRASAMTIYSLPWLIAPGATKLICLAYNQRCVPSPFSLARSRSPESKTKTDCTNFVMIRPVRPSPDTLPRTFKCADLDANRNIPEMDADARRRA
jgi:hypothetical protein